MQPHEYQARLVARAGRERTVFARGKPILGSCAGHTVHSGDRAFLPTEFGHQFGNKRPRDRVFRNVRPDGAARRTGNRSRPSSNLEGAVSGIADVAEDKTGRKLRVRLPQEASSTAHAATSRASATRIIGYHAEEKSDLGGSSKRRTTVPH